MLNNDPTTGPPQAPLIIPAAIGNPEVFYILSASPNDNPPTAE